MEYQFSNRMENVQASAVREILKLTGQPGMISFAGGNPSADAFPTQEIEDISNQILSENPLSVLQYGITEGDQDLIKYATQFFDRNETIMHENDKMIITSGSQQIMEFCAKCICNEEDIVVCENPSFLGALNAFKSFGAKLEGITYKDGCIDLEALESLLSKPQRPKLIYLIPNFQNPTGYTMDLTTRKAILELSYKYNVLILEDNPYGDLRFEGEPIPSIKSLDTKGHVIYAASLSKIIAPGMRVACCVADKAIIQKIVVAKQANDVHSCLWSQKVMARYLQNYDMNKHIEEIRLIYKEKCHLMLLEMEKYFASNVEYNRPEGGMFIWVTLPDSIDVDHFIQEALKQKVAVVPGKAFMTDDSKPCQSFRMNFSTPSNEDIIKGVEILGALTHQLQ